MSSLDHESVRVTGERVSIPAAALFYSVLLLIAVLWSYSHNGSAVFTPYLGGQNFNSSISMGIIGAMVVIAISSLLSKLFTWAINLERRFARFLTPLNLSQILSLSLLSGVVEELFFRAAMQPSFGLIATSVIFSLAHFVPSHRWIAWSILTFPVGIYLGFIFEQTQNLWGCIVAHTLINFVNLSLLNMKFQGKRGEVWAAG